MSDETPEVGHFGPAFNAAVSNDWAITADGFRTVLAVASRTNAMQAVEAYKAEGMRHTQTVSIRDGVAIIPITGPISRYMTWFSMFSGGTSISVLGRDFAAALDNPDVYSIMFEINSPGGEVTGVSEFAQMVLRGRSKKPITARVGGMGCSAAYWIAAMCGDIVIDRTAQLGSIGVMAVYMDDRKKLEMEGLEELEFISSQSPYKNAPPYENEGKQRIQKRIDAIADVFVSAVAQGRGVSTKTVLAKFGQGDVFIGEAAVTAGLADRMGSFEETLRQLAKTHTPGYVDSESEDVPELEPFETVPADDFDDDDSAAEQKTIKVSAAVEFETVETQVAESANSGTEIKNGDLMDNEKDLNTDATETSTPAPAAGASVESFEELKAKFEASEKARETANAKIEALEADATGKWIGDQVAGFAGDREANVKVLGALIESHGKDSDVVAAYLENQKAVAAQLETSDLFKEVGKSGSETGATAEAKLDKMAKDKAVTEKISYERAYQLVLEENKDLASEII